MVAKAECPNCGDQCYPSDPVCFSCGADLRPDSDSLEASQATDASVASQVSPADWVILPPDPARAERLQRAKALELQVECLIEQGYHKLPKAPDARYGPADDVSDLCREIGECYLRNDDDEAAARWLERAVVVAAGNVFARAYLVGTLCRLGRYDEAEAWYDEMPGEPIDRNVVRSWLELPDQAPDAEAARQRPMQSVARRDPNTLRPATAGSLQPAARRALPLVAEPRSA